MQTDDSARIQIEGKLSALREQFRDWGSVLIAFSGGVDSTFLLKVAVDELGSRALAVTATSPTYPRSELETARRLAERIGVRMLEIESDELNVAGYRENPPDRCYYCKSELFSRLQQLAAEYGIAVVCDGTNADDLHDHRPGMRAACELGVASPLAELGFTKDDIRCASRDLGLPTWDKPSFACLASRIPYGETITAERLEAVDRAEAHLRQYGFGQLRVRSHGTVARIEIEPPMFPQAIAHAQAIAQALKAYGFDYVALDLEGYRTGSMNAVLDSPVSATATNG